MDRWTNKTKVILNSSQFKSKLVEVGVELGNMPLKLRVVMYAHHAPHLRGK